MNALYQGHVVHARAGKHKLRYRIFMLALDLDDLPTHLQFFSHNRANLASLHDKDHAGRTGAPIKPQIERKLRQTGIAWDGGRIVLLTMPRLLNYVFNPLSVYFCFRHDGSLAALAHEVSNTFGERHFYILPPQRESSSDAITQSCAKKFFVSPFLDMNLRYEFHITPPGPTTRIAMKVRRGDATVLTASFTGARRDLTDANLLRAITANPLMTLKVITGIHWEALKIWLKGVKYIGRGITPKPHSTSAPAPRSQKAA